MEAGGELPQGTAALKQAGGLHPAERSHRGALRGYGIGDLTLVGQCEAGARRMAWSRLRSTLALVTLVAALLLVSGCGTLRAVITSKLRADLALEVNAHITATGLFANMMGSDTPVQGQLPPGSKVDRYWEGQELHVVATGIADPSHQKKMGVTATKANYWLVTYFHFDQKFVNPNRPSRTTEAPDDAMAQQMAASMFSVEFDLEMPGTIIESNGVPVKGSGVRWTPSLQEFNSDSFEIRAVSRRVNPGACVIFVLAIGVLVVGMVAPWRKPSGPSRARRSRLTLPEGKGVAWPKPAFGGKPASEGTAASSGLQVPPVGTTAAPGGVHPVREPVGDQGTLGYAGTPSGIDRLIEATRDRPDDPAAWHHLAAAYMDAREFASAVRAAERVTQLAPDNPIAWSNLGRAYRKLRRFAEAERVQNRALALRPGYAKAQEELAKVRRDGGGGGGAPDNDDVLDVEV